MAMAGGAIALAIMSPVVLHPDGVRYYLLGITLGFVSLYVLSTYLGRLLEQHGMARTRPRAAVAGISCAMACLFVCTGFFGLGNMLTEFVLDIASDHTRFSIGWLVYGFQAFVGTPLLAVTILGTLPAILLGILYGLLAHRATRA